MYYYLYEIRNVLNDKIYVGVHKTKNLNDGYMGSGKVIRRAIEKHGLENFTKTILETFDDSKSMYAREKEIVTDEFLLREDTYNLRRGGNGGFDYINANRDFAEHNKRIAAIRDYKDEEWLKRIGELSKLSHAHRKLNNGYMNHPRKPNKGTTGYKFSNTTKTKMALAQTGCKNSQHNSCWVYNDFCNKKISKNDLHSYLNSGWNKGRKYCPGSSTVRTIA